MTEKIAEAFCVKPDEPIPQKWVCNRCGRERSGKPVKNEVCNADGCKGRFKQYRSCRVCGSWFPTEGRTVCNECAREGHLKTPGSSVTIKCAECGKLFSRPKSNARGRKQFCNIECMRKNEQKRWVGRVCLECGKEFKILKSTLEKSNATGHYCSEECYAQSQRVEGSVSWKGGFNRVKREHFGGIQFCAICGTTKDIHIHHIIPYRMTHDNSVGNLIPLCARHHVQTERKWLPLIDSFENKEDAKQIIEASLRVRQETTLMVIKNILWKVRSAAESARG